MASNDIMSSILAGGINAIANKPQKTSSVTNTETMITPNEYADMLMRRNSIGNASNLLNNISKEREKPIYALAQSLSNYGGQSTPGQIDWASGIRSLGGAFNGVVNAKLANAQQAYDLNRKDLEDALKFDKEMGTRQQQTQTEQVGYNQGNDVQKAPESSSLPKSELDIMNKKAGKFETNKFDPSNSEQGIWDKNNIRLLGGVDYGVASSKSDVNDEDYKRAKAFQAFETSGMDAAFDALKALRPATDTDVKIAMRKVGADPTLSPEERDRRIVNIINQNLVKSNISPVKNLAEFDSLVNKNRGYTPSKEDILKKHGATEIK